jgi:hypothetical protein
VEASAVKLAAAMQGERTSHTAPTHTTAESAAHTVYTHSTSMRAHSTTAPAHTTTVPGHTTTVPAHTTTVSGHTTTVSTTTVPAATTVSATTTTGECNSWGEGDRCTDYGGDHNGLEGLSKHGSVSSRWRATPMEPILATAAYVKLNVRLPWITSRRRSWNGAKKTAR